MEMSKAVNVESAEPSCKKFQLSGDAMDSKMALKLRDVSAKESDAEPDYQTRVY